MSKDHSPPITVHKISNGDIAIWRNEGGAISVRAVDNYGDPVELSKDEVLQVIGILKGLIGQDDEDGLER